MLTEYLFSELTYVRLCVVEALETAGVPPSGGSHPEALAHGIRQSVIQIPLF